MSGLHSMEPLQLFARFLARTMGLHFSKERLPELGHKMTALGREQGFPELAPFLLKLMSAPLSQEQMDILACTLTIGETYFLRDPKSYRVLEEKLLPELIAARRGGNKTIRIWSAGCSTGEEPYSIAILLSRVLPDIADWKITLLGTDINPLALERARRGVYSKWSFRNAPRWLFDYFTTQGDGRFQIDPAIKKMVRFSHLNLADEGALTSGTKEMDIIFCRNVMLYFSSEQIEKTMALFHDSLSDSGWLFVGPTEIDHQIYQGFTCLHFEGAFVLAKTAEERQATGSSWQQHPEPEGARGGLALFPWGGQGPDSGLPPAAVPSFAAPAPAGAPSAAGALAAPPPPPPPPAPPRAAEAADPGTPPGAERYRQAQALYQAGQYQQAAELALSGLEDQENRAGALTLGARAYANIGRFAEALDCCKKAIDCDKLNAQNHYLLSIILEQQGDAEGAVRALKHALFIDHDYLLAYFALGNLLRQCGERRESERNFANALRLLERRHPHEVLPEAEGMTAGRLAEVIRAMTESQSRG